MTARFPEAVILFGASGFIGQNIARTLSGRVALIVGVTNSARTAEGCSRIVSAEDLASLGALPADTIAIHVAAHRYDASKFELAQSDILTKNARLIEEFYEFCAHRRIKEVRLASSVAVYDANLDVLDDSRPIDLNTSPHAHEALYGWSKRWAEILSDLYSQRFGISSLVFRLSNPYGPFDSIDVSKAHVAPALILKALDANPILEIKGNASVARDFTFVGDVAEVFSRSLSMRGEHFKFNLCSGRSNTLQELAETIIAKTGIHKEIRSGEISGTGPAKRASTSDRVQQKFGMTFKALQEGMGPTVEWYKSVLGR